MQGLSSRGEGTQEPAFWDTFSSTHLISFFTFERWRFEAQRSQGVEDLS